jgi:pyruvate,orthophosphate dikinase
MDKKFYSKALEVNLNQTKQEFVELSEDHKWLLSISESRWGINQYTKEFFNEYHHNYPNYEHLSSELRKIAIGDFWLYSSHQESERALQIINDILRDLISKKLSDNLLENLIQTRVDFCNEIANSKKQYIDLIKDSIYSLRELLTVCKKCVLSNSVYIRQKWAGLSKIEAVAQDYFDFMKELSKINLEFWQDTIDIEHWLSSRKSAFTQASIDILSEWGSHSIDLYNNHIKNAKNIDDLIDNVPLFSDFANHFRRMADKIESPHDRFQFIVYLLSVQGMSHLSHFLLVDLNSVLRNIFDNPEDERLLNFLTEIFNLFKEIKDKNPSTVLDCLKTIGLKLSGVDNQKLLNYFQRKCLELGFIRPGGQYMTSEWRMDVNPYHVKNIRVWLEIFQSAPEKFQILLAGLTANLKLGGIFIFDTDLFQKDVSSLLNSDIKSTFKLTKQLCRIFPVYFNEIGAEGELRDVTTQMDEISHRQDLLIHFLRKQIHIESNNTHIALTINIYNFWIHKDKSKLRSFLPDDVYFAIDPDGVYVKHIHQMILEIAKQQNKDPYNLIHEDPDIFAKWVDECGDFPENEKKRLKFISRLNFLLEEKYSFNTVDICKYLKRFNFLQTPEIDILEEHLNSGRKDQAIKQIYKFIEQLNDIILNDKKSEGWENIYYKRHVAFGIPSMYGEYHERRFESLGIIFKLERLAADLTEGMRQDLNLQIITANSLHKIAKILELYRQGIKLDGISIKGFDLYLKMFTYSLQSQSFSLQQHINLFRFMSENVKEIITKYFLRPYDETLLTIIPQIFDIADLNEAKRIQFIHAKSEEFYRGLLSSAFLLQSLDSFVAEVSDAMHRLADNNPPQMIRDIMSLNTDMMVSPFYSRTPAMDNQVFIGSKAYFLKTLYLLDFPVPPGFVITTEVFRRKEAILQHEELTHAFGKLVMQHVAKLEKITGNKFGSKTNPLLLSVRSGTAISMPGAMNTFLNVGINEEIAEGLSKKDNYAWTSWDCYRRFLQTWGMSNGIARDVFDQIMKDFKIKYNVAQKVYFTPAQMREMALSYKKVIMEHGVYIEEDPEKQLRQTILDVFNSWSSPQAIVYRKILQIADEWGTAVIVQKMVLGNLNYTSGTGVLFTHAPHIRKPGIYLFGDYSLVSQGEDIVGGLVNPRALSSKQPNDENPEQSLQVQFPDIYERLLKLATDMIDVHGFSHQEIEFTFESQDPQDLYILQTRDQDLTLMSKPDTFTNPVPDEYLLGRGIGIGGGAMNGIAVFDENDIREFRKSQPDKKLILVRPDTVPEDIGLIFETDGLITARGGATSHAAVTAVRLGKICVVNVAGLIVNDSKKQFSMSNSIINVGDEIAIDGTIGCVYKGNFALSIFEEQNNLA